MNQRQKQDLESHGNGLLRMIKKDNRKKRNKYSTYNDQVKMFGY